MGAGAAFPPDVVWVDVGDATLGVVRWRADTDAPVAFAVHGFSGNAWSWAAVARHLDSRVGLVAIDLRGRGLSHDVEGPFGIRRHADDVAAVIRRLNASPAVVAGHSMGAYVALAAAERRDDVADIVLVDGGAPLPPADDVDPNDRLDELLGIPIDQLDRVWADRVAYRARWAEHPAFGDLSSPEIERYVLSDLVECDGGFRSRVSVRGVSIDGRELLADAELNSMLERREGTRIVVADTGPDAAPPPLVDDDTIAALRQHHWRRVPGSNHFSVLLGEPGAAAVAEELLACCATEPSR
jgi:pimeloyl-ACP methyl ester carboxylesterase